MASEDKTVCTGQRTSPTGSKMREGLQCWEKGVDESGEEKELENRVLTGSQPALSSLALAQAYSLLPGENGDIRVDVSEILSNGKQWLATPNSNYGGRCPSELIGTPDEILLRNTLRSLIYSGMA